MGGANRAPIRVLVQVWFLSSLGPENYPYNTFFIEKGDPDL